MDRQIDVLELGEKVAYSLLLESFPILGSGREKWWFGKITGWKAVRAGLLCSAADQFETSWRDAEALRAGLTSRRSV